MKVHELIAKLQQAPQNADVVVFDADCCYVEPVSSAETKDAAMDRQGRMVINYGKPARSSVVKKVFLVE